MNRTLQELLDYAETCLSKAAIPDTTNLSLASEALLRTIIYWQQQSIAASQLAHAVALSTAVKIKPEKVDLSE